MTHLGSKLGRLGLLAAIAITACGRPAPAPIGAEPSPGRPTSAEPAPDLPAGEPAPDAPDAAAPEEPMYGGNPLQPIDPENPPKGPDQIALAPGVQLQKLPDKISGIVRGAPPSASRRLGTVYLSVYLNEAWALIEWDPITREVLRRKRIELPDGLHDFQTGEEALIARSGPNVVRVSSGFENGSPLEVSLLDSSFNQRFIKKMELGRGDAIQPGLAADDKTIIVTNCKLGRARLRSFDARTGRLIADRRVGAAMSMCVGFRRPMAPVELVNGTVWVLVPSNPDPWHNRELVGLSSDLSREVARVPIPDDVFRPHLAATSRGIAVITGTSHLRLDGKRWASTALENASGFGMDPTSGATITDTGYWISERGDVTRRFVPSPVQTNTAMPYFPFSGVLWVEGHALVLLSRRAGDYLAIVEPPA